MGLSTFLRRTALAVPAALAIAGLFATAAEAARDRQQG